MIKRIREKLYILKVWYRQIFLYPVRALSAVRVLDYDRYWETKRAGEVGVLSKNEKKRAEIITAAFQKIDGTLAIGDIGCGPGTILAFIRDHRPDTAVVGYDSSEEAIRMAKAIGLAVHPLDVRDIASLSSLPPADFFLLLEVLEHVPNSEEILDILYRKARRGVFFSFPNSGFFVYRLRLLFGRFPVQWISFPNEHLRFWTARDLRWWLGALGYTKYHVTYYRKVPFLGSIWPSLFAGSMVIEVSK